MANQIELREINKLIKEKFFIPTYQRGYRWDDRQVTDLLNDVYEFMGKANIQNGEFYCLQPIVVKKKDNGAFEVIDGQQRLTTIMIIQKYLEKRTYSISYASREGSEEFLENIAEHAENEESEMSNRNIDYFFMAKAFCTVKDWFESLIEEKEEYSLPDEFSTYLLKYCKVIWYEVEDSADSESIFTRLNIGKIPLTNAELIKALFLRKSNFETVGDKIYLRQLEIANEWDSIENKLQDDKVWYFINPDYANPLETRIEYIFDVIADKGSKDGENYTFISFSERMEEESIVEIWEQIKSYYRIILEWYEDQELFHLIGFLASSRANVTVRELLDVYFENEYKKSEFEDYINERIREYFDGVVLEELSYEDSWDQRYIRDVLLLFNVITVMNKSSAYSRFPFDSYNKKQWSLEHIHAQSAEGIGNSRELWISWIDEHLASFRQFTDSKYKKVVKTLEKVDRENITLSTFENLFDEISSMISDDYGVDLHNIDNMALLDCGSNSSISNNFFDVKRAMIIEKDRIGEFIPVCTRNVFLKYYSTDPSQIHYWSESDRIDYLSAIKTVLADYIDVDSEEETDE
nr:DUF262 domain-containing protein [uncultured Butyrivibrio sp.]